MIDTIFFDLDGTLLPLDTEAFLQAYFNALGKHFANYFPAAELKKLIWTATMAAIGNLDKEKTNEEAFFEVFYPLVPHDPKELSQAFDQFYLNHFKEIQVVAGQSPEMIEAVQLLKEKGYRMVVATNPIFPYEAVKQRIEWAGLRESDFIFVSSFENMHFCKPHVQYYQEILDKIDGKGTATLMVGNDRQEDMVAKALGCTTFFIDTHGMGQGNEDKIDYRGGYGDFLQFVREMPSLIG